jgi:hypothetical protein
MEYHQPAWTVVQAPLAVSGGEIAVLKTIEGVYRDGHIELAETPADVADETHVIVTFLAPRQVDLRSRGLDEAEAADLRARLASFADEWDSPEMDIYDDYDAARAAV